MAVACVQDQSWANNAVLVRQIGLTKNPDHFFGLTSGLTVWSNQNRNYFLFNQNSQTSKSAVPESNRTVPTNESGSFAKLNDPKKFPIFEF